MRWSATRKFRRAILICSIRRTFTGGGQKLRLRVQLGTQRQDYELSFIEPWFLNRKLALGVDLYRHQLEF
jgi:outer membrane protein assembly factor BamA